MLSIHDSTILLHLSLIEGVGPATVAQCLDKQSEYGSLNMLYDYDEADYITKLGVSPKTATLLAEGLADDSLLNRERELLEKHQIAWISMRDQQYPELLKHISGSPVGLYAIGDVSALATPALAVVGSRDATAYGTRTIAQLIPSLVANGYTIVSGGAYGIDTAAHKATLDASGRTIVVCGSGLLQPYPRSNARLFDSIAQAGGAIISSFPLRAQPLAGHFPARNRIISGMTLGCLVVQAAAKSGSLITAHYALNQGRHVFAIPGPIDDPRSTGCNSLIQQGAQLVCKAEDIIASLGSMSQPSGSAPVSQPQEQQLIVGKQLTALQDRLVQECAQPTSFDELLEHTGLTLVDLQKELFTLQLEGVLVQNGAGLWERA